jgi:hypothetical protein
MLRDFAWLFGTFGNQMQNNLFQTTFANGTTVAHDLLALNINRGRDHGLPTYTQFFSKAFNINITSFSQLQWLMAPPRVQQLQKAYS